MTAAPQQGPGSGPIVQVGYVVADLDASVESWVRRTGTGPWTVIRNVTLRGPYRGEDTEVVIDVALGYSGQTQIELIQPTIGEPSPYVDDAGAPLLGPHHVAWCTDDLDASIAAARATGLEVLFAGEGIGTRVAYLQSPDQPGVIYEYIQMAGMRDMIAAGVEQARVWGGTDPIRVIG
ncbi:VOC family protein [Speluncibacter jeojiensis]|uniref:VOC family protein n=1 Tax=Speluncibacter jeojiensis TaxID=2710754 RepID=A0A9X4RFM6_9ACTN|nr:VOC family protein [Corynebacteriales bacterium D3-21]